MVPYERGADLMVDLLGGAIARVDFRELAAAWLEDFES
jgi:hypothetical protein